jgi:hypothetical protein
MTDRNDLAALFSSVNRAFDLAKTVRDAAAAPGGPDTTMRMAELIATIIDAKFYAAGVRDLVRDKEERIAELEQLLELKSRLVRVDDAYYEVDSAGERLGSPFCSRCWEVDHKAVHLTRAPLLHDWICPECKSHFTKTATG